MKLVQELLHKIKQIHYLMFHFCPGTLLLKHIIEISGTFYLKTFLVQSKMNITFLNLVQRNPKNVN